MSIHPPQSRARFYESENPSSSLEFHYNPTEWVWERGVDYEPAEAPGRESPTLQFKKGRSRSLSVELFLNDWGEDLLNRAPGRLSVVDSITWLDRVTQPTVARDGEEGAPPLLLLEGPRPLPMGEWALSNMRVTTEMCAPLGWRAHHRDQSQPMDPIRARVQVTLTHYRPSTV